MPSFRVLQQRCSHFSLRFRCSRIEIRPDINNLIKKITIKRPCEFGTRNTYACFKSHKGATQRLIMPLNTAPLFSYLTFPFRGFVALVVPWCPESPAQISRGEMFVVGRVNTSLRNMVDLLDQWILLLCTSHSLEQATGISVLFVRDKCAVKMEADKEIAQGNIPSETWPVFGAAGVVKITFTVLTLQ